MKSGMKIVVLCGGLSTERKISLSSGTQVCRALREKGHKAVLVDMYMGLENVTDDPAAVLADPASLFDDLPPLAPVEFDGKAPDLYQVMLSRKWKSPSLFGRGVVEICRKADIVFNALHGANGEDGRVQAAFDLLGIPYTGSGYLGAAMAMDKLITKQMVSGNDFRMPAWQEIKCEDGDIDAVLHQISAPCVVKTPTGGSSVGVVIVRDPDELRSAVEECLQFNDTLLVEQLIEGREFTCAVLKDRALPSVEIAPKTEFYNYENKYRAGATEEICPGRCSLQVEKKMGEMALYVHRTLGLRTYSRSDFIVDHNDNVWFLEVNTLPGMTPTSLVPQEAEAVGISFGELCETIIEDALGFQD